MCRNTQVLDIYRKEGDIILKTTAKGICLNLNESEYYFKYKGLVFYFSSEFYRNKFANEISSFIETETFKIQMMRYMQMSGITDEGYEIKNVKNKTEQGNQSLGFELV